MEILYAKEENDNEERCDRHIDSKRCILAIILNNDFGQHKEEECEDKLRTNNNETEEEEAPEFVIAYNFLEDIHACQSVDFLLVKFFFNKVLFLIGVVEAQEYEHDQVDDKAKELDNAICTKFLLAILLFTGFLVIVLVRHR